MKLFFPSYYPYEIAAVFLLKSSFPQIQHAQVLVTGSPPSSYLSHFFRQKLGFFHCNIFLCLPTKHSFYIVISDLFQLSLLFFIISISSIQYFDKDCSNSLSSVIKSAMKVFLLLTFDSACLPHSLTYSSPPLCMHQIHIMYAFILLNWFTVTPPPVLSDSSVLNSVLRIPFIPNHSYMLLSPIGFTSGSYLPPRCPSIITSPGDFPSTAIITCTYYLIHLRL